MLPASERALVLCVCFVRILEEVNIVSVTRRQSGSATCYRESFENVDKSYVPAAPQRLQMDFQRLIQIDARKQLPSLLPPRTPAGTLLARFACDEVEQCIESKKENVGD